MRKIVTRKEKRKIGGSLNAPEKEKKREKKNRTHKNAPVPIKRLDYI